MFVYDSRSGLFHSADYLIKTTGYSGHGAGRNNPAMENVQSVGPIPRGHYTIGHVRNDPGGLGPLVMNLEPKQGTNTYGRSLFRIHGDNAEHDASHGCIILSRPIREAVAASPDKDLLVV